MDKILEEPLYAVLAFSIIVGIVGYRFVSPIVDRISKSAKEKQAIISKVEGLADNIEEHEKEYKDDREKSLQYHEGVTASIFQLRTEVMENSVKLDSIQKQVDQSTDIRNVLDEIKSVIIRNDDKK